MNSVTHMSLDLQAPNLAGVAAAKQHDRMARQIAAALYDGSVTWTIPGSSAAFIRYAKPDGTGGFYDTMEDGETPAYTISGNVITFTLAEQMLTVPGAVFVEINFYNDGDEKLTAFSFVLQVEGSVLTDDTILSDNYYNVMTSTLSQMAAIAADLPTPSTSTPLVDTSTGVVGDSANYARGNHAHPLNVPTSGTPSADGTGSRGSASTYARSDHIHPLNVDDNVTPSADAQTASAGTNTHYSRADHVHPTKMLFYSSVTDLGETLGYAEIDDVFTAMAVNSVLICPAAEFDSNQLPAPMGTAVTAGAIEICKTGASTDGWIEFHGESAGVCFRMSLNSSGVPSGFWKPTGWTLVWSNSSPTSSFSAKDVNIDLLPYSEVKVIASISNSYTNNHVVTTAEIDGGTYYMRFFANTGTGAALNMVWRTFVPTSTKIAFNAGATKHTNVGEDATTDNDRLIPLSIYAR